MRSISSLIVLLVASLTSLTAMAGGDAILLEAKPAAAMRYHTKLGWREAAPNRVLREGAYLRCPGRCRLRLADGSQVDVTAAGEIRLLPLQSVALPKGLRRGRTMGVEIFRGEMEILTPPKGLPLRIHGPDGVGAVILHGRVLVRAFPKRLALRLAAQAAFRRDGRKWQRLEGEGGTHVLWADRHAHRPELVSPTWRPGPDHLPVSLATGEDGELTLAWHTQNSASKAEVRLTPVASRRDGRGRVHVTVGKPRLRRLAVKGAQLRLPVGPGRYRVALRLADTEGFWSPWSVDQETALVRTDLPAGGHRSSPRDLSLPPGTALRVLRAPAFEAAVGDGGFFHDPKALKADEARGRLRLRLPGLPNTLSTYALRRQSLTAKVSLTPVAPTWPYDDVTATVLLHDPSGRIDPADAKTRTIVRLGKRKLDVAWKGEGARRHAMIRGRGLRSPALLEVIVTDEHGHPLGRAFVEVIGSGPPRRRVSRR